MDGIPAPAPRDLLYPFYKYEENSKKIFFGSNDLYRRGHDFLGHALCNSHRQLLRYEKDRPEPYCYAQNDNILKKKLAQKMRLWVLTSIGSFPIT
jgi:hypothetical protein